MSFSSRVKRELCKTPVHKGCCAVAEAYGILLYANSFSAKLIKIITGSREFAGRLSRLFKKAFDVEFDALPEEGSGKKYIFAIESRDKIERIFESFGYDAGKILVHHVNLGVLEEECCRAAFVRGAYLAGGSMTDPEKRYHMELVTPHKTVAAEVYSLLLEMGFSPKDTARAGNYVTYFKQSEAIEDIFTTIGAPKAAMELMEAKVEKDMRNAINRRVNCDSANADRIVSAAQTQLEKIRELDRQVGIFNLPPDIQQAAFLRIANPDASLSDLAQLSNPPVSKGVINNRFRKLMKYDPEKQD